MPDVSSRRDPEVATCIAQIVRGRAGGVCLSVWLSAPGIGAEHWHQDVAEFDELDPWGAFQPFHDELKADLNLMELIAREWTATQLPLVK